MAQPTWNVRASSGPSGVLAKFPDDDRIFNFNFSGIDEIQNGAVGVSAVISPTPQLNNLTLGSPSIDSSGAIVSVRISAGGASITYLLECNLTLDSGSVIVGLGLLTVIDPNVFAVPPPLNAGIGVFPPGAVLNPMVADVDAASHRITGAPTPISGDELANMAYVLAAIAAGAVTNPLGAQLDCAGFPIVNMLAFSVNGVIQRYGSGPPSDGSEPDGSFYFRSDGGTLTTMYQARSGVWVGIV
jgi:hypothetical protein